MRGVQNDIFKYAFIFMLTKQLKLIVHGSYFYKLMTSLIIYVDLPLKNYGHFGISYSILLLASI